MRSHERLELDLPAEPASVTVARHEVVRFAEKCGANVTNLAIAVSEAVGNAVVHAYRHARPGPVRITAERVGADLVVSVVDSGRGMAPNPESKGLGLGLALMARAASGLELRTRGPGLTVSMRFPCPG
jgi:anti-sigma regulatory factor (Ser/Thr protein kinase)